MSKTRTVQLIVTGDLEELALHLSLRRLFETVGADVEFLAPRRTQDFTSTLLRELPPAGERTPSRAAKLARDLVAAVALWDSRGSSRESPPQGKPRPKNPISADYIIAVDDLELVNAHQPLFVLEYLRHALRAHITQHYSLPADRARVYETLSQRASFHLLTPMAEAYFFGEPAALKRAKATQAPCRFDPMRDVEDFEVNDPDYLRQPAPEGVAWDAQGRHRHPKDYVRYLCSPTAHHTTFYRETHEGVAALSTLDWPAVLKAPIQAQFARSLIHDIADALDIESPCPGECAKLTARKSPGLLRNI